MAKKPNDADTLFKRLTNLFKSGALVKRKIKDFKTPSASTALDLFRKTQRHAYSNVINAYGMYDRMCVDLDTMIPVPGSERFVSMRDLIKRYPEGEKFIVYAYDETTRSLTPAWAHHPRSSGVRKTVKVTFDDGSTLICTPDHPCLMRDTSYRDAGELKAGDSMMPFYRKAFNGVSKIDGKKFVGYESIYVMQNGDWKGWTSEHRLVYEWSTKSKVEQGYHVHHKDFNPVNNDPANLDAVNATLHLAEHGKLAKQRWEDIVFREKVERGLQASWDNDDGSRREKLGEFNRRPDIIEKRREHAISHNPMTNPLTARIVGDKAIERFKDPEVRKAHSERVSELYASGKLTTSDNFKNFWKGKKRPDEWKEARSGAKHYAARNDITPESVIDVINLVGTKKTNVAKAFGTSNHVVMKSLGRHGFDTWEAFIESVAKKNHKVVSVEPWLEIETGDLTVAGYENFATSTIIVHNSRYSDSSEMEYTPEIASALDIYSDESCSQDEKGRSLHIHSDDVKIRRLLEELFYDTLNVEFNLRSWTRNLCKFGDMFLFNDVSPDYGIINAFPIAVNEIEREEGYDPEDPLAFRFRWVTQGNQILENWQLTHFRLLGNDAFLPYGSSVIEPARRIWRQLILIEDAMLVYRVVRSPERRVFYIDVANVPPEDIPAYMEQAKARLRTNQVVDKTTGRVDLRYNPLCHSLKTLIKLQDDRTITLGELIEEWDAGKKDQWVHSIDIEGKRLVPGKIEWAGITKRNAELVRVHIDTGNWFDCTPDHRFLMRDGTYKRADELREADALMPHYEKLSSTEEGYNIVGYPLIYDPFDGEYKFSHRVNADVALLEQKNKIKNNIDWTINNNLIVHHKDFNSLNSSPNNLEWMGNVDHYKYHASIGRERLIAYNTSDEKRKKTSEQNKFFKKAEKMGASYNGTELHKQHNSIRKEAQLKSWGENKVARSRAMRWNIPDECINIGMTILLQDMTLNRDRFFIAFKSDEKVKSLMLNANETFGRNIEKLSHPPFIKKLKEMGFSGFADFKNTVIAKYKNHKVLKVEKLTHTEDVGCITVSKWHNFAAGPSIDCFIDKKCNDFIYLHNSVDEDYFIPRRGSDSGTQIETLPGGTNTTDIDDVEYIQRKLFAALKIPKAYLGYDESLSSKSTLAQEDIRFSRTIGVIQRTLLAELNKLATIHLFAHGFEGEDIINFNLQLSNPSTVAQQQKIELYRTKFEVMGSAPEGMLSRDYVRKNILNLTDDDIREIERQKTFDRLSDLKLESLKPPVQGGQEAMAGDGEGAGLDDLFGGGGGGGGGGGMSGLGSAGGDPGGDEDPDELGDDESGAGGSVGGSGGDEMPDFGDEISASASPPEDDEEEPEEEADDEDDDKLLTSVDKPAVDKKDKKLSYEDDHAPLKANAQLKRERKGTRSREAAAGDPTNRSRRRTHGPTKTHFPDFNYMTKGEGNEAFDNKDDSEFISGKLESISLDNVMSMKDLLKEQKDDVRKIPREVRSIVDSFQKHFNIQPKRGLLSESIFGECPDDEEENEEEMDVDSSSPRDE